MRRSTIALGLAMAFVLVASTNHPLAAPQDREHAHQTITVHGHWTLDVRNPDGTLAQHRDVENSLVDTGRVMLAKALGGKLQGLGDWILDLNAPDYVMRILNAGGGPRGPGESGNLLVLVDDVAGTLTLSGSVAVPIDHPDGVTISSVDSRSGVGGRFTHADLDSPVQVKARQTIDVSVTFSFGS